MLESTIMNSNLKSPVTGNPMSHVILEDGLDTWHCKHSGGALHPGGLLHALAGEVACKIASGA